MRWIVTNKWVAVLLSVIFVAVSSGCQYARSHQGETVGAGVGAAAGTAAGLLLGGSTRTIIAGGLLGAIAGASSDIMCISKTGALRKPRRNITIGLLKERWFQSKRIQPFRMSSNRARR
jgi:hypothetical protein